MLGKRWFWAAALGAPVVALAGMSLLPLALRRPVKPQGLAVDEWTGNCAVVEAAGVYHDIIKLFTNSTWTHVYVFLDASHLLDPTWPHMTVIGREELPARYKVGVIAPELTLEEKGRLAPHLQALVGQRYGLEAVWWFAFNRTLGWRMPGTGHVGNLCSTGLTRAYSRAGLYARLRLGDQRPETVSPADLAEAWGFPNPVRTKRVSLRVWMERTNAERAAAVRWRAEHPQAERRRSIRLVANNPQAY